MKADPRTVNSMTTGCASGGIPDIDLFRETPCLQGWLAEGEVAGREAGVGFMR